MTMALLKYAGSKGALAESLIDLMVPDVHAGAYYEPFCGTAAVALELIRRGRLARTATVSLNDANRFVVGLLRHVRGATETVVRHLQGLIETYNSAESDPQRAEIYTGWVSQMNAAVEVNPRVAALVVTVNRTCFNGLMRLNASGKFNVPFANKSRIATELVDSVRETGDLLRELPVGLTQVEFDAEQDDAHAGDIVYYDPPYFGTFSQYTARKFQSDDLERLAEVARRQARRGVAVYVSNSDCPEVRAAFVGSKFHELQVPRRISCKVSERGTTSELFIVVRG